MIRVWIGLSFGLLFWAALFLYPQSPSQQMAMRVPTTRRPWVVSKTMIARMQLEPITEKGYIAFAVKGEDGNVYSIDDVLAGVLEIHERERK